jgi:hypothetical protein
VPMLPQNPLSRAPHRHETTSMGIRVALDDDFAGVLGRVQLMLGHARLLGAFDLYGDDEPSAEIVPDGPPSLM